MYHFLKSALKAYGRLQQMGEFHIIMKSQTNCIDILLHSIKAYNLNEKVWKIFSFDTNWISLF